MERPALVQEALDFQKLSLDAFGAQCRREDEDLSFQVPEKQWPEDVRVQRQGQTIQGVPLPARPMLSIPSLGQPIQITFNQWLQAHYGISIHPQSQDADDDTARVLQGLYRAIEVDSRANLARGWGFDRGLKAGRGAYRVDVVYDDTTDDPDDLKISIKRILRQSSIYWDPFSEEPDFSDQRRCLIVSFISRADAQRQFPKANIWKMTDDELITMQSQMPNWSWTNTNGDREEGKLKWIDGENDTVCIAEYFYTEWIDVPAKGSRRKARKVPQVMWAKINAIEILEGSDDLTEGRPWNGAYIPIIPTVGNELQPFDEERRWQGIIGPNKDSARLLNYEVSNAVEKDALVTKAPWVGPVGSFRTNQQAWLLANVRNLPYVEYDPISIAGTLAQPPQRNLQSVDLSAAIQLIQLARESIQAGTYTFDESLGRNTRQKSGKAVQAIQQQGDLSQSNYLENMANISMPYEAKVVLDLICGDKTAGRSGIYDREGRIAHIIGEDNKRKPVMLNAPFTMDPNGRPVQAPPQPSAPPPQPGMPPAAPPMPDPNAPKVLHYDLSKGKYGVVVSVGKAFQTRMQEGSDALSNIMQADPQLTIPLLPVWAKFQDFPGHDEVLDIAKKIQPPPLQDHDANSPQAMAQQLSQANAVIHGLTAQLQHASTLLQTDAVKMQGQKAIADAKAQGEVAKTALQEGAETERNRFDNETKLAVAELGAKVDRLGLFMDERARLGVQAHDVATGAADAGHEQAMGQQQADVAAAQAAQQHAQALQQGQQASDNTMAQIAQQAALQPPPQPPTDGPTNG